MKKIFYFFVAIFFTFQSIAQNTIAPSSTEEMWQAVKDHKNLRENSIFKDYPTRNIGPTVMGGRVVDVDKHPNEANTFYVAYASGGLFKTSNNGGTFEPIFDNQARLTIGDIAISPANPDIIWVGTGENNSSRSSYAGFGIYKTTDGGKTWEHLGLENTQHIGRIIAHPTDPNIAWVASLGALYSTNEERGIYKTTDGGKTWNKTLFINDNTGVIDLVINPQNPNQLWTTSWERSRKAWEFVENGEGSALYSSEDGGETWNKITEGLPESKFMGRMGIDICQSQPNVLYLVLDNQEEIPKEKEDDDEKLEFTDFLNFSTKDVVEMPDEKLEKFLRGNGFPKKYTAQSVKSGLQQGNYTTQDIANYYEDANNNLFETQIRGTELYRSDDYGKSWQKVNSYKLDGLFYTYGYYFGQVRVSPQNPDVVYLFGVPLLRSEDGGKTFKSIATYQNNGDVHADHHAMLIDPSNPNNLILGNDGGVYLSYDAGDNFIHLNNMAVGQFYTIAVDMAEPYNVYGGLQDNGVFYGSSKSVPNQSKEWQRIMGGDGMFVGVNPLDNNTVYTGYQFGNYFRVNKNSGKRKYITPKHDIGEEPYRFNWRTPVVLSKHNPDIVYFAGQKLFRSFDKGETWESLSEDLTQNKSYDNVPYSTITCVAESPLKFNIIYVGTDDGNVQVSRDAGDSWSLVNGSLPPNRWVSSIFASSHEEGTVFITLNGYRGDEITTYVYKSEDFGQNWTSLKSNLPNESCNVIVQDPVQPNLLYLGTDLALYISFDGGESWEMFSPLPNVAMYDMIIHPRENELVVATHGRSMYVIDVKPLQKMANQTYQSIIAFRGGNLTYEETWGEKYFEYLEANEPQITWQYFIGQEISQSIQVEIQNESRKTIKTLESTGKKGFHSINWDVKTDKGDFTQVGKYKAIFKNGSQESVVNFEIKEKK